MTLFFKEFFQNKVVRNYIIIIFFIIFIVLSSLTAKNYFFKIINDNYQGSYIIVIADDITKINDNNIAEISRCVIEEDTIIIEEKNIQNNDTYQEYKKKSDYNSMEKNISKVSQNKFKEYKHENSYYIKIYDWMKIDNTIGYLTDNNYEIEFNVGKKVDLTIENYYQYFDIVIILIIIICFIVYVISIVNIIIDDKTRHYLYSCLGYTNKEILFIQYSKIFSLLAIIVTVNEILQIIIRWLLNISISINYNIYFILIVITAILIFINNEFDKLKK